MPLLRSPSQRALSENIKREMEAGKPRRQAVAIAMENQRRMKRKSVTRRTPKYTRL